MPIIIFQFSINLRHFLHNKSCFFPLLVTPTAHVLMIFTLPHIQTNLRTPLTDYFRPIEIILVMTLIKFFFEWIDFNYFLTRHYAAYLQFGLGNEHFAHERNLLNIF